MKLQVNKQQRLWKMRAHTATHLLHYCLDQLLSWTKQSWSVVDTDLLRFDFATREPLNDQQITSIEVQINEWIAHASDITITETDLESAKKLWAKAFFEDKYGDIVRVVSVDDSVELCGGIHVKNTADIGAFKIIAQEAVASWIRRIVAVTGTEVAKHAMQAQQDLTTLASTVWATPKQLPEKIGKMQKQLADTQAAYEWLKSKLLWSIFGELPTSDHEQFDYIINITQSALKDYSFKEVTTVARQSLQDKNWIFYSEEWAFAVSTPQDGLSAKQFIQDNWIRGGWSDSLVQGKDPAIVELFK